MEHSFNIEVAEDVGVLPAIIFQHLMWWISKNEANDQNFHDGQYWTYNSIKAYTVQFPYMSEKQIRNAIQKLVDSGYIRTGNYNSSSYDRTLWYGLGEYGKSIYQKWQMHLPQRANGVSLEGKPIPVINTIRNNTVNKKDIYNSLHSLSISKENQEEPPFESLENEKTIKKDMNPTLKDSYPKHITSSTAIQELYNTICTSLPRCTIISDSRRRAIATITKSYSMEQIEQAFKKAQASDFLSGRDNRWKCSFDWLMNTKNMIKVLEGNYDNKDSDRDEDGNKKNPIEKMNPNSIKGFKIF